MINNGIISKPAGGYISLRELARFFGCAEDLKAICTNVHINPWSKKKPVKWNEWNPSTANWWKTANGMCGFRVNSTAQDYSQRDVFTELSSLAAEFIAGRYHPWVYERPTGGSSSPFRLLDFNGYSHNAQSPAGEVFSTMYDVQNGNTNIGVRQPDDDDGYSLTIGDFPGFSVDGVDFNLPNCYLGVMLVNTRTNAWVASTLSTRLGAMTLDSWVDISFTGVGTVLSPNPVTGVSAFLFFSSVSFVGKSSTDENDTSGVFMSAFGVPPTTVSLHRWGTVPITTFGPAYSDEDLVWENAYVTCDMGIGVAQGTSATLTAARIHIATYANAMAYDNGSMSLIDFRASYFGNHFNAGSLTLNPSTVVNMSIYASTEDGFDPSEAYVCVLEAQELSAPVIDWTVINTNP